MNADCAEAYRAAVHAGGSRIAEGEPTVRPGNELELQARWFAGEFGRDHVTTEGVAVHIEDFGRWNHEAGPDFIDARLVIDGHVHRGPIELDLDLRDWDRHGHAANANFCETVLHLFVVESSARFFTRTCDHRNVPQVRLAIEESRPAPQADETPPPITRDAARARMILQAAARHRLALKAAAVARHATVHGEDEAWFAALAMALGYKRNQIPFALLAQRVTRRAAREALLFGAAGFLEAPEPPAAGPEVRAYLRGLWEDWWSVRAQCARWILPTDAWQFAGLRPINHPHRRVAALAGVAENWTAVRAAILTPDGADLGSILATIDHPFWADRFNLASSRMEQPQALIGAERIRDIRLNLHFPLVIARDETQFGRFLVERGPTPAAIMTTAGERFFGGLDAAALRFAAVQQGLLQIERDYRTAPDPAAYLDALRQICENSTPPVAGFKIPV